MEETPSLHDLTRSDLIARFSGRGYSEYYAGVVWEQLYRQLVSAIDELDIKQEQVIRFLQEDYRLTHLDLLHRIESKDGKATKYLFSLVDGEAIESVLMYFKGRATACISTQSGCAMGCVFCATGQLGFRRHLAPGEIVAQVLYLARDLQLKGEHLRNIVLMGMGEPLHNYNSTMTAINILMDRHGLAFGPRYITLSTVGIPDAIRRLADEGQPFNLAVSLHSVTEQDRRDLLPVARKWSLSILLDACRYYVATTGRRIFFEWALIDAKNDTPEQAHALGALLKDMDAHVNLIPLNATEGFDGFASRTDRARQFQAILAEYEIPSTIRQRRGIDIGAGCGQLSAHYRNGPP